MRHSTALGRHARLLCSSSAADAGGARGQILDAALQHVASLGWSREALAAGAVDVGLPSVSHGIVTGGEVELVHHFMDRANKDSRDEMQQQLTSIHALSPARRVGVGLRARLSQNAPFVSNGTWPQAMALGALPNNALRTARLLAVMSSNICSLLCCSQLLYGKVHADNDVLYVCYVVWGGVARRVSNP